MVSAISSYMAAYYTVMANNSALNMFRANNSRMGLMSSPMMHSPTFGSMETLATMDTQYDIDMITNSLQYKMAKAMLNQIKKQQMEDAERFSLYA